MEIIYDIKHIQWNSDKTYPPGKQKKCVLTEVRLIMIHESKFVNISPKVSSQRHLNITIT